MWIYDIRAEELINLKDCTSVWKHQKRVSTETVNYSLNLILNKKTYYLHYESEEQRDSAFSHYAILLKAKELDVNEKPVTL